MLRSLSKLWDRRPLSAGIAVALLSGAFLTAAAPVSAAEEPPAAVGELRVEAPAPGEAAPVDGPTLEPDETLTERPAEGEPALEEQRPAVQEPASGEKAPAADAPAAEAETQAVAAAVEEGHSISGIVSTLDADGEVAPAEGVFIELDWSPLPDDPFWDEEGDWEESFDDWLHAETYTAPDGSFLFEDLPDGEYSLWFDTGEDSEFFPDYRDVLLEGADVILDEVVLMTGMPDGTAELEGDPVVGETLSVVTDGWPVDADFSYLWLYADMERGTGGYLDGVTGSSWKVTADHIGDMVGVLIMVQHPNFAPTLAILTTPPITAPKQAAAPPPVADSSGLGSWLVRNGSTPKPQSSAGLPAGSLNPAKSYEAEIEWNGRDSFVDVYFYSTPVFVGTFAVRDGVVQIRLGPELLSELGAGSHTLVLLGQSSGDVQSVNVSVAAMLATTGADPSAGLGVAGMLVLLGGVALLAARRASVRPPPGPGVSGR
jgi:hypothetical protein